MRVCGSNRFHGPHFCVIAALILNRITQMKEFTLRSNFKKHIGRTRRTVGRRQAGVNLDECVNRLVPRCMPGDYVRIQLGSESVHSEGSIWMRVERCDDKHKIVYGTIEDEPLQPIDNVFRAGSRLGASYRRIRESRRAL